MQSISELSRKINELINEKKFAEVHEILTDEFFKEKGASDLYFQKARTYLTQKNFISAIEYFKKYLETHPKSSAGLSGLGDSYKGLKDYDKSIEYYKESIKTRSNIEYGYTSLGSLYNEIDEFDKAIEAYTNAINANPIFDPPYYNRATVFQEIEKYQDALDDYKKYIELTLKKPDYFTSIAKSSIKELDKIIGNIEYSKISEIVNEIKKLLLYTDDCITHYTSFLISKALILEASKFRLSEGTYLNDTSEGKELFNFLPQFSVVDKMADTEAKPFAAKPFIGSFVPETKHDDLALWRMYGKENKEEARGCAITIKRDNLLENLKSSLISQYENDQTEKLDNEFNFYRVAYSTQDLKNKFIVPGVPNKISKDLNKHMNDLLNKVIKFLQVNKEISGIKSLLELLNGIAYLFKSAEYQYEHELRLVVKGTGIVKNLDNTFSPPKVYIELVSLNSLMKKITLGPKVEKADEWASTFYYTLDKMDLHPEIFISHLPFK